MSRPQRMRTGFYHEQVRAFRKKLVEDALRANGGNMKGAALDLGLTYPVLYDLRRRLGLRPPKATG